MSNQIRSPVEQYLLDITGDPDPAQLDCQMAAERYGTDAILYDGTLGFRSPGVVTHTPAEVETYANSQSMQGNTVTLHDPLDQYGFAPIDTKNPAEAFELACLFETLEVDSGQKSFNIWDEVNITCPADPLFAYRRLSPGLIATPQIVGIKKKYLVGRVELAGESYTFASQKSRLPPAVIDGDGDVEQLLQATNLPEIIQEQLLMSLIRFPSLANSMGRVCFGVELGATRNKNKIATINSISIGLQPETTGELNAISNLRNFRKLGLGLTRSSVLGR